MKFKSKILATAVVILAYSCGDSADKTSATKTDPATNNQSIQEEAPVNVKADFGTLLIELESNIGWDAVIPEWKERRDLWIDDCNSKTEILDKANLLVEFESHLKWEAVDARWADRREAWIVETRASSTDGDLGTYLAELEEYIIWDVVSPNWANIRDIWVENCAELSEGQW